MYQRFPWLRRFFVRRPAEGIVTLADANYFPGLMMLHRSVQTSDYPVPILCFDIGLSESQRASVHRLPSGLTVASLPDSRDIRLIRSAPQGTALAKSTKRVWPLWICPFLIAASPFRRTAWIDADAVVLRNLRGLFWMLDQGPVFTPENLAPDKTPNYPELYQLLPIARPFDPAVPTVNGGVSAWDLERDARVLAAYQYPVRRAFEDPQIKAAISWHDQGALIWAIQRHGLESRVAADSRWNQCVKHTPAYGQQLPWDATGLDRIRELVPQANILHWNGTAVPWAD
jgi:hypothetical protein